MTQRNPLNERYQDENRGGVTRRSSASAKPKTARAGTVHDPAPKSKKQKKEEARERERKAMEKSNVARARFEDTETYKRLRRYWWIALVGAIACTAVSFFLTTQEGMQGISMGIMVVAYALIIVAFWLDLGKIRKERKLYTAALANDKSKAARKEQKKARAEQRAQEKEAAEKYDAAKAEEAEKAKQKGGFFDRFRKKKDADSDAATDGADGADDSSAAEKAK